MKYSLVWFAALFAIALADNHLFRNADLDGDSHLTEEEFDGIFDHWDSNNDSRVDQYEFTTGWERDDWDDDVDARIEFHLFDSNDDGYVTDVPDLRHMFLVFDANGDLEINAREFKHAWDALFDH